MPFYRSRSAAARPATAAQRHYVRIMLNFRKPKSHLHNLVYRPVTGAMLDFLLIAIGTKSLAIRTARLFHHFRIRFPVSSSVRNGPLGLFTAAALSGFSLAATNANTFVSGYRMARTCEAGLDGALCFCLDTSRNPICGSFFGAANFLCRASH
jgi:hypothetical protein